MTAAVAALIDEIQVDLPDLYEIVDGEIVEKEPTSARASDLTSALDQLLGGFVRTHRLGRVVAEMLFRIDASTNLQRRPDLAFVSAKRWPPNRLAPATPAWDMVPDLAVEVLGPTNKAEAVDKKIDEYFKAGVEKVWVIMPMQKKIYIHSPLKVELLTRAGTLEDSSLFPGFQLPLEQLFDEGDAAI